MRNDILPAHRAGFQSILFAGDQRSLRLRQDDPSCRSIRPDAVITDLFQLKDLL
jgi:putative hydrolase of the HAD superfamily